MISTANHSFAMYPGLSHGALATLKAHGSELQKQMFMPSLISGEWTGTMCLTESHCGTDLGMLRTKAELQEDGTYAITGSKIFISAGEHDLSQNIVHIVLARIVGAPAGVKGISLFVVPKYNANDDGSRAERNNVACGSIEHKMGINANATCLINFDSAKGHLIGAENRGLSCMFTFMNSARLGVAMEGVAAAEMAFQGSLAYAKDRLQMRSISGAKNPEGVADPIIVHPDVRRMLLTQKSIAEGGRALVAYLGQLVDVVHASKDQAEKTDADNRLALLTPIAKAFLTEIGFECASHGVQIFGGHGFIKEWGMEQIMRDTKISCLYEGTTGIQALDLMARKVLGSKGELLTIFTNDITEFCLHHQDNETISEFTQILMKSIEQWQGLTQEIAKRAANNPDEAGAASVDYLMFSGYVTLAFFWAKMVSKSLDKLKEGDDIKFYEAKIKTARFYFERILPRSQGHAACIESGGESMMALSADDFVF